MSKGGGGPDTTKNFTSTLPEWSEPYWKDMMARTGYESAKPYTPYGGKRLEWFSAPEQEAMNRMSQMGVSGTPDELNMAGYTAAMVGLGNPYANTAMEGTRDAQSYMANMAAQGPYDANRWIDPGISEAYMDPYMQQVTDIQKREAARQSDIRGNEMGLAAAGQGSLGGYREAIMQSERERNLGQQMDDIQKQGLQHAWEKGQDTFGADESRLLDAWDRSGQRGLEAASQYAGMGQSMFDKLMQEDRINLEAGRDMAGFAGQRQDMEYERLKNMQAAGQTERELRQRGLDVGYADFLRQQGFGKEQVNWLASILHGTPSQPGQIMESYGVGPSTTQQLMGSGIAGVGLYNAMG